MLKPLFPSGFIVPEHQLRSPNYPITHSPVLGNLAFTGGFCEPHGHSWKPQIDIIDMNGDRKTLPPANRNLGVNYCVQDKQVCVLYPGEVIQQGWEGSYGNRVHVKYDIEYCHAGKNYTVYGAYAHLEAITLNGRKFLEQGDRIGIEGGTGGNYPDHVDYRQWIVVDGKKVDLSLNALEWQLAKKIPVFSKQIDINIPSTHNINIPLKIVGYANQGVFSVKAYSVYCGVEYPLGTSGIEPDRRWEIVSAFNTTGDRLIVVEALDGGNKVIDQQTFTVKLTENTVVDPTLILSEKQVKVFNEEWIVTVEGKASLRGIQKVVLKSPFQNVDYRLKEIVSEDKNSNIEFVTDLKFSQGGDRRIIAEGYDINGVLIATTFIDVKLKSSSNYQIVGIENTSELFRKEVEKVCDRLDIKPEWLLACMSFETGGTFSPSVKNPVSTACGLIQFMDFTAKNLGTTVEKLAKMTAVEQLVYVEKYFASYKGKLKSLEDVYMAILWPAAISKGSNHVLFRRGSNTYHANRGLDTGGKGYVTVADAASKVKSRIKG